jgi:hypothetical protein
MIRSGFAVLLAAGAVAATTAYAAPKASDCDQQILLQIDSARISTEPDGFLVDAFGVAESAGWSKPTLVVTGKGANGAINVDFVACRPEVSAQVLTPIQTRVPLDLDLATTRQIVIRAKTNSMTVDISR